MTYRKGKKSPGSFRQAAVAVVATAVLLAGAGSFARAEEDVTKVDPVQVTATRIPKKVSEQAASVGVVSREEIEMVDAPLVGDSMQNLPGVEVLRKGTPGNIENIRIRGGSARGTLSLIDGFPVNSPTLGEFDIGSLPADAFDRIEVVRGAQSSLYGSNAMSGVVNFVPRKGASGTQGGGGLSAGSYNSLKWNGYTQGAGERGNFHLGLSGFNSDGQFENDATQMVSFLGSGEAKLGERSRLHGIVLSTDTNKGVAIDGTTPTDVNHHQDRRGFLAGVRWETELTKKVTLTAYGSQFDEFFHEKDPVDPGETSPWGPVYEYDETTKTRKQNVGLLGHWAACAASDTFLGVEYAGERQGDVTISNYGDSAIGASTTNRSVYLQQELRFRKLAGLSAGVRADKNSEAGTQYNPKAAAYFNVDAIATRFRAGVGRGFRVPSFMDKHNAYTGNPGLAQETTVSHEAGADVRLPGNEGLLSVTWFYQQFSGLIEAVPPSASFPNGRLENLGHAFSRGIEAALTVKPVPAVEATLGYTLTDSWDSKGQARVQGIPRHRGTASVVFRPVDRWESRIDWRAESDMMDLGPADFEATRRPGFARTDLSTRYGWVPGNSTVKEVALTAEIRNVFNREYEERRNYPAPGATFMIGTQIKL